MVIAEAIISQSPAASDGMMVSNGVVRNSTEASNVAAMADTTS